MLKIAISLQADVRVAQRLLPFLVGENRLKLIQVHREMRGRCIWKDYF